MSRVDIRADPPHDEDVALNVALILAAAALALWTHVRFGSHAPAGWGAVAIHLALSMAIAYLLVPAAVSALVARSDIGALAAVVAVALPAFTYRFLASLWLVALVGRMLGQHAR